MPKHIYPDNYKIEVVNHYRTHGCVQTTLDKYGIAKSTLFKWKNQYENNLFSKRGRKQLEAQSPQARSHQKKMQEIKQVRKECRCPVTASTDEKMKAIQALEGKYSIHVLCDALQLPRGTYYNRKRNEGKLTSYQLADEELKPLIKKIFHESGDRYGRYPIRCKLLELGYHTHKDHISRLMKEMDLKVERPEYVRDHLRPIPRNNYRNVLAGNFQVSEPNKAWVSDITYIKVNDRYMFICVIIDLFSRRVVSYGVSDTIDAVLVMTTFHDAYYKRNKPKGLLFHSDQGVQYTSYSFRSLLKELKVIQSFSSPGYPYDNAVCESFFHTLKKESLYRKLYKDAGELVETLDEYIEFYNFQRLHRTLKRKTPSQIETEFYYAANF